MEILYKTQVKRLTIVMKSKNCHGNIILGKDFAAKLKSLKIVKKMLY